jgi:hypothetical protein
VKPKLLFLTALTWAPVVFSALEDQELPPPLPCHAPSDPTCVLAQMQPPFHFADEPGRERQVPSFPLRPVAAQIAIEAWVPYSDNWMPSHEAMRPLHPRNRIAATLGGGSEEWMSRT